LGDHLISVTPRIKYLLQLSSFGGKPSPQRWLSLESKLVPALPDEAAIRRQGNQNACSAAKYQHAEMSVENGSWTSQHSLCAGHAA